MIAFFVIKVGMETAKDAVLVLLDVSASRETDASIRDVLDDCEGVMSFENLKLRKAGPYVFGEVCIKVKKSIDVEIAHDLTQNIEKEVLARVPEIESFTIHVEPFRPQKATVLLPLVEDQGLRSRPSSKFARAPYFLSVTVSTRKIKAYSARKNSYKKEKVQAGLAAAKEILQDMRDALIVGHIGEIAFHTLRGPARGHLSTRGK